MKSEDAVLDLATRTESLLAIPSVSNSEGAITDYVHGALADLGFYAHRRVDDCLSFLPATRRSETLILLAGHTDTVPPQGNETPRLEGDRLYGLGASDMKSGVAVMIELASWVATDPGPAFDVGFVFFGREELPAEQSNLPRLFAETPEMRDADLVVVLEPTGNAIHAGCLGNVNAELTVHGVAGHSARPWLGRNAIHLAIERLHDVVAAPYRPVTIDGLEFVESLSVTKIHGGVASNVIPDRVVCTVNFRFAPDRTTGDALTELQTRLEGLGELAVTSVSSGGPAVLRNPLVDRLLRAGAAGIAPKQAWTPVAQFADEGMDAICFGPGAPEMAHRPDEFVSVNALSVCHDVLKRFIRGDESEESTQ
ncbi:MAG TPA: succinyl-diaminopimelate desuccinylase [Actinomycetota bacterium]|nr:succinyl-diaminopimelate desuccinylase [Actinomycetota bacterium]